MENLSIQFESCQSKTLSSICLLVTPRTLQFFFFVGTLILLLATRLYALSIGEAHRLDFVDIDGNKHSTADGRVTVIALTTPADRDKARALGDRIPERCLGNPDYRMITIIRFSRRHTVVGQRIATAFIRHRVNEEARRLQVRYDAKKIARDARRDIFVATDFDGSISSQLGEPEGSTDFSVFVFGRNGELIAQWRGIPSAEQLDGALK
jgi:hypothetical protein